jgi:Cu-processing system permease protein
MNAFRLCASQELTLAVRSRWTQIFAGVFLALSLFVAGSGYALSGGSGVQDFARTGASLVQLVLLVVPLTAIVIGVLSLSSERGSNELLYSQPVPRTVILLGRMTGLFGALAAAQAIGFGGAGVVIFARAGSDDLAGFALLVLSGAVLTAIYLALAGWIAAGVHGRRRTRALAMALVVWFVTVILFDIAVLGIASLLRSSAASRLLVAGCLMNPIAAVRTAALLGIEGTAAFGGASLALLRVTHGVVGATAAILLSITAWIVLPSFAATRRLLRSDL